MPMNPSARLSAFVLLLCLPLLCIAAPPPNPRAIAFYYNWYGSPQLDGAPLHWAHDVLPQNDRDTVRKRIPAGGDIAANFYPQLGEYSSADPATIDRHLAMAASARIGILAVTWLGSDDPSFRSVPLLLDAARRHGLKICFQIEPRARTTALAARDSIREIVQRFGAHPAFYRDPRTRRPLFFVYDSYVIPAADWARVLAPGGADTIRGSEHDADVLGLWVGADEHAFFEQSGFDGFYTYFASRGFSYGATPEHWPALQRWARERGKLFVPSVGPGYIDTRVRPWNAKNSKDRDGGRYYDAMFRAAIDSGAPFIGITSFNEWHEGTQIEPATTFRHRAFDYLDYAPRAPDYYLKRTGYWLKRYKPAATGRASAPPAATAAVP
ncbi:glycoprotein endo-alpha-1,2-mannosidase [Lysobacter sp. yr284]|nr:glycoprotein endo-alpha-1,2-mannosidase [Lysobacter sp. yr284]